MGVQRVQSTSTVIRNFPTLTPPLTIGPGQVAEIPDTITLPETTVVSPTATITAGTATYLGPAATPARLSGTAANRPAASAFGEGYWYNTDLQRLDYSNGTTWTNGVGGGGGTALTPKTSAYTAVSGDFVQADASSGGFTITLPTAKLNAIVSAVKIDSSTNVITIVPAAGTINGQASITLNVQYTVRDLVSDGTNWLVH